MGVPIGRGGARNSGGIKEYFGIFMNLCDYRSCGVETLLFSCPVSALQVMVGWLFVVDMTMIITIKELFR